MSYSQAGRIERAVLRSVTAIQLARVGAVVGLDVRIRAYPGPAPIRDAAQVALMSRSRSICIRVCRSGSKFRSRSRATSGHGTGS